MKKKELVFKPRARLLLQLGDQLIKNQSIALLELIKNSYDADANLVEIKLENLESKNEAKITIEDDGEGMNDEIIENIWMEPGSDHKQQFIQQGKRTKKFKRLPIGEKGIGRFGVHKIGQAIELISRRKNEEEVYLKIDWRDFINNKYLKDVPITITVREPELFIGKKTGTRIVISHFHTPWTRGIFRDTHRAINSLNSPFVTVDSFNVFVEIDKKEWIEDLLSWDDIENHAMYKFKCVLSNNRVEEFEYEFVPFPTMKKLSYKKLTANNNSLIKNQLLMKDSDNNNINLSNYKIGKVKFEGLIYDLSPKILQLGVQDKKGLKDYLKENGGIRVYRDGIRINEYGEKNNDWLNLDIRRVNIPAKRISNNLILSSINLLRTDSTDLIEKTNREGFIENAAYTEFTKAILFTLNLVENLRQLDKEKVRTFYEKESIEEPFVDSVSKLKEIVDKRIKDETIRTEINKYILRIQGNYTQMRDILLQSSGAGLSLSIVIHEIEKLISEIKHVLLTEKPSPRLIHLFQHLARLIEGYSLIIKRSENKPSDLIELINQALFNLEFRLDIHKVTIINKFKTFIGNPTIKCSSSLVINAIMNLLDNSLFWFDYAEIKDRKIFINITRDIEGYVTIIFADNGPGFSIPLEDMIKPFVTTKPEGAGSGLGLHIVSEIIKAHNGIFIIPEKSDFSIPNGFSNGAILGLCFPITKQN